MTWPYSSAGRRRPGKPNRACRRRLDREGARLPRNGLVHHLISAPHMHDMVCDGVKKAGEAASENWGDWTKSRWSPAYPNELPANMSDPSPIAVALPSRRSRCDRRVFAEDGDEDDASRADPDVAARPPPRRRPTTPRRCARARGSARPAPRAALPCYAHRGPCSRRCARVRSRWFAARPAAAETQLPRLLLEDAAARGEPCRVVVAQPRRLAATSLAHRERELGEAEVGGLCGCGARRAGSARTALGTSRPLETPLSGMMKLRPTLSQVRHHRRAAAARARRRRGALLAAQYTHVVVDEVRERSLDVDLSRRAARRAAARGRLERRGRAQGRAHVGGADADAFRAYFEAGPEAAPSRSARSTVPGARSRRELYLEHALAAVDTRPTRRARAARRCPTARRSDAAAAAAEAASAAEAATAAEATAAAAAGRRPDAPRARPGVNLRARARAPRAGRRVARRTDRRGRDRLPACARRRGLRSAVGSAGRGSLRRMDLEAGAVDVGLVIALARAPRVGRGRRRRRRRRRARLRAGGARGR